MCVYSLPPLTALPTTTRVVVPLPLLLQSPVATVTSLLASQLNLLCVGVTIGVASSRSRSNGRRNRCGSGVAVVVVVLTVVVAGVVVAVVCIGSSSRSCSSVVVGHSSRVAAAARH